MFLWAVLMAAAARAHAPLPQQEAQFRRQALSLRTFGRLMREAKSKHVLAVFDSCFAGTVFNTARTLPTPAITRATLLPVRQFVSSGEADQEVSDDGTFRRLFLDALRGNEPIADANQDGYITGTELGLFLSDKVTNLTRNLQTPRYGKLREVGLDRGDFVFALPRTRPPVTPQPPVSEAAAAWRAVERSTSCGVVRAFRDEYRGSVWERLASARLDELKCATVAPVAEPRAPAGPSRTCEGVTVSLGSGGTACINPGSGKTFRDCPTCPEMVVVPAGSFMMGSPKDEPGRASDEDQVRVTIAKPFAVGAYEVTFDEWDACVAAGGCDGYKPPDLGWGRGRRPVINVSWHDARVYANWLSAKTGQTYRLLSEAEWEYAARAGTTTPFWWGSSITPEQANYRGTISYAGGSIGEYRQRTLPVDSFAPNPWGLFNVHGNVWEWTEDCWNSSNKGNPGDGTARAEGSCSSRLVRGGSLVTNPQLVRSASRSLAVPTIRGSRTIRDGFMGFRLARMLLPPSP